MLARRGEDIALSEIQVYRKDVGMSSELLSYRLFKES